LKPEWWGSPLAQEEKYQGRKKTSVKRTAAAAATTRPQGNNSFNFNGLTVLMATAERCYLPLSSHYSL
jgi:hypothetical protein